MAWIARNSDNTVRTPSAFVRHDTNNDLVAGGLSGQNAYVKHDASNADDPDQPTYATVTDPFGNQYKNWNGDFVPHNANNEDKNPAVPLVIATTTSYTGINRVQEVQSATMATYTGGTGTVVVEGRWERQSVTGRLSRSSVWTPITEYSTDATQTYTTQPGDADYDIRFVTHAYDDLGVNLFDYSDTHHIFSVHTITSQTTYTGIKKVGQTLNIYAATATGGIPPINYLLQARFSDSGTGGWGENQTLKANLDPSEMVTYTIPVEQAGRYVQIRTRTRDAGGSDSAVYNQIWSTAPDSALQIAAELTIATEAQISGEAYANQTLTGTAATYTGGYSTVTVESKFVCRENPSDMWHDCTPFSTETTQTYTPLESEVGKELGFMTRAVDGVNYNVVSIAGPVGPVAAA